MKVVIVDRINEESKNLKEELLYKIDEISEVLIIDNETEALNLVRMNDYELFILNTIIDGIDNDFINYCNRKSKKVIVYTDDRDENKVVQSSVLKLIDYVIKSESNDSETIVNIIQKYLRNSDLRVLFYSNDEKTKLEIVNHIESQNLDILEVKNEQDIFKFFNIDESEILIIDFEMLDSKGIKFIKNIRQKYNKEELPIIIFAYFIRHYIVARFLRSGVNSIIYKPYLKEEFINSINLIIDRKTLLKESYEWFMLDPITGLYRFKAIENFGEKILSSAKRDKNPFSLIMVKINFEFKPKSKKKKNQVLKHFGNILGSSLRKGDLISRYRDDKILIILNNTPEEGAKKVIEKLKEHIKNYPCLDEYGEVIPYTIIASAKDNSDNIENDLNIMIDIVDDLLYRKLKFGLKV